MLERLADHAMFAADAKGLERLRMCEDCRVVDMFSGSQPMAAGVRRTTRTTDEELRRRPSRRSDGE